MDMRMDVNFLIQDPIDTGSPIPASIDFTKEDFNAAVQLHNYWNDAWAQDLAIRETNPDTNTDDTMSEVVESHSEFTAMDDDIPSLSYSVGSRVESPSPAEKVDGEKSTPKKTQAQKKATAKPKSKGNATQKSKASNKSTKADSKLKTEKASSAASKGKAATNSKASNANKKQAKPKSVTKPKSDKSKVTKKGKDEKIAISPRIKLILKPESESERST
ncbi:hypothetical protein DTO166G4_1688 [Paecilomyces variotii]|nr:hypothetical protein DTO166G4_1688 [Paecilomyces variotii]KAJ9238012.1 hypothetical protein DTO166G5_3249 [Paecilomyces variotii]KAJ9252179.1 hypothetical protein DTO195F2_7551 [Paecilomyces variotii]